MDTILDYLDGAARLHSDRIVYTDGSEELSFAALRDAAGLIAAAVACAEDAEQPVAVLTGRHVYTPACYLGIAMAGCFYAPMDPGMPEARLRQILDVVRAGTMIADREHASLPGKLGYTGRVIIMEDVLDQPEGSGDNLPCAARVAEGSGSIRTDAPGLQSGSPSSAAEQLLAARRQGITETTPLYVLFTSGSTGRPKGVLTSHQAMMCYLDGLQQVIGLDESDVLGNQAPLDYIAAIRDMYLPLMTGASTVILHPSEFAMPGRLMTSLARAGVTTLCWSATGLEIPARLGAFDDPDPDLPQLKRVVFSGSIISNPLLRKWQDAFPDALFINQYGPTEATGSCTYHVLDHVVSDDEIIPIGRPYRHYSIELLADSDEGCRRAHTGETGEICVRGPALALGYYDAPEQTDKSFALSPLQTHWPERMYRTGDLGRRDKNGLLYFLGRKDRQFKHLGHRVEPEEIEQKALTIEGIEECSCAYDQAGKIIYLFYAGSATPREIAIVLRRELPSFMVPRRMVSLERLPHLPNGKLDRKALDEMIRE